MALQNLFELLSFSSTLVFSRPEQFEYPVLMSCGAVAVSAVCYATFVRQRRGHLLHLSRCLQRKERPYSAVPETEGQEDEEQAAG